MDVRDHAERERPELVVLATDHRDQRTVAHIVRPRQVGRRLVADDGRACAPRDVAGIERMVGVPVRDDDVVGALHVAVDQRRVGAVERIGRDVGRGAGGCPPRELRQERIDEHHGAAVGDLPAGVAEVREAQLALLQRRQRRACARRLVTG